MSKFSDFNGFVNEAKSKKRAQVMSWIEKTMKVSGTTEDFNGSEGGIWLCGECGDEYKGKTIYDHYTMNHTDYRMGVLNQWEDQLNKMGWYSQWYDAGTVMVYPI